MLIFFLVSLLASVVGAICGIGGGVIIKPVLDVCGLASVSTISFLSGLTVLSMSLYSVGRTMASGGSQIDRKTGTPLAIGAAAGGIAGKQLFSVVKDLFADPNTVGAVQAACLAVITLGTLLYTIFKGRIAPRRVEGAGLCLCIGLVLGIMSSFLGIGGGGAVLLFRHGHQDRCPEQPVCHPVQPGRQPGRDAADPQRAGV